MTDEDLHELRDAVQKSAFSVALFDMTARRILALSATARQQFGLGDNDLSDFDIVEASRNPDAVRRLIETILENELKEWRWRSLLPAPDGSRYHGIAIGRIVAGVKARAVCLVRYHAREPDDELVDEFDAARLLEPSFGEPGTFDRTASERRLSHRAAKLEGHLSRIAREVEAAGILPTPPGVQDLTTVPGLHDLSTRQWEVLTRLVAGQRVPTIARAMFLSPSTVRNHLASIYRKMGVSSQAELLERVRISE